MADLKEIVGLKSDEDFQSMLTNGSITYGDETVEFSEQSIYVTPEEEIKIPTKTSELINDSGFITGYTETDPTVPSWAKSTTKPSYSYSEITEKPTLSTVATSGSYNDLSDKPNIPTKTSEIENDSGFITSNDIPTLEESDPTVPSFIKNITELDIQNWNSKSDFSGDYNDLTNKPEIPDTDGFATKGDLQDYISKSEEESLYISLTSDEWYAIQDGDKVATSGGSVDLTYSPTAGIGGFNDILARATSVSMLASAHNSLVDRVATNETELKGLASVAKTGSYNDLSDKPEIPSTEGLATTQELENTASSTLDSAKTYTDEKVANLVGTAPETLDTLQEVATAIQENETVVDALNSAIGNKVDKVEGKGLSTNDYTTTEKEKLAGVEEGANNYVLPNEVVQDASYVHTDNNYTTSEKEKLAGLSNYDDTALSNRVTAVETKNTEQDASINQKLPLSGGTMTGNIDMNGNDLTNIKNLYDVHGNLAFGVGGNFYIIGNEETFLGFLGLDDAPSYNGRDLAFASDIDDLDSRIVSLESADTYIKDDIDWLKDNKADLTNASQNITANDIILQGFSMFNYCADLGARDYIVEQGDNYIRWNGGKQICWDRVITATTGANSITFPLPFIETPSVCGTFEGVVNTTSYYSFIVKNTLDNTGFQIKGYNSNYSNYFAIGKWK